MIFWYRRNLFSHILEKLKANEHDWRKEEAHFTGTKYLE